MDSDSSLNIKLRNIINNINDVLDNMDQLKNTCSDALKINGVTEYKNSVTNLEYSLNKQKKEMREIRNKLSN